MKDADTKPTLDLALLAAGPGPAEADDAPESGGQPPGLEAAAAEALDAFRAGDPGGLARSLSNFVRLVKTDTD